MTTERWVIVGLLLALVSVIGLYAGARSEANERWKATLRALDIIRNLWPSIHAVASSPRPEDQLAGAAVGVALQEIEEVLLCHELPLEEQKPTAHPRPTALDDRIGVSTRREGRTRS